MSLSTYTNTYTVEFFAKCPGNGVRVKYSLQILAGRVVMVEDILEFIEEKTAQPVYHEQIADALARRFPGLQIMRAHHHGVDIVTTRGAL